MYLKNLVLLINKANETIVNIDRLVFHGTLCLTLGDSSLYPEM